MTSAAVARSSLFLICVFGAGCSSDGEETTGACRSKSSSHLPVPGSHVADCSPISYDTNPPSSGAHYGVWPAFGVYRAPLPRGYWVHALEHGAVVITHRCQDCDVTAAEQLISELVDPGCASQAITRAILTPDPLLDIAWAASAWGVTLRASCFDLETFRTFFSEHVGKGPEDVCSPGQEFRLPDGSLGVAPGCGAP